MTNIKRFPSYLFLKKCLIEVQTYYWTTHQFQVSSRKEDSFTFTYSIGIPSTVGIKCKTSTTTSEIHKAFLNFLAVEANRALKLQIQSSVGE